MLHKLEHAFDHPKELSEPLTPVEMFGSITGNLVMTLLYIMTGTFMSYYYTDVVGLSATLVGTIMLVTRVANAFTDVGMGVVVAKTRSRFGRARPWFLRMALPLFASVVLAFSVEAGWNDQVKAVYAFVTYMLMITITFTAINIAGSILGPLMTSSVKSREQNGILTSAILMVGSVVGAVGMQRATSSMGDTPAAWRKVAMVFALIALVGQVIQFFFTKERTRAETGRPNKESFRAMLPAITNNAYFLLMCGVTFLSAIDAAFAGASIYYYKCIFGDPSLIGVISVTTLVTTVLGIALVPAFLRKIEKKRLVIIGLGIKVAAYLVISVAPSNVPLFLVMTALRSFCGAPMMALSNVFLLNTIEYGEARTGIRAESLILTISSFGNKVGTGIGGALIGWLLATGGYVSGAAAQPESVGGTIVIICCILPAVLAILQMGLLYRYDLQKQRPQIIIIPKDGTIG